MGIKVLRSGETWPCSLETSPAANKFPSEIGNNQVTWNWRGSNRKVGSKMGEKKNDFWVIVKRCNVRSDWVFVRQGGLFRSWRRLIHRPPYPHVQQHFLLNVAKSCKGKLSNWAHRQNFSSLDPDQKLVIDGRVGGLWRGQARGKQWQRVGALSLVCPQTQLWRRRENVSESLDVMPLSFFPRFIIKWNIARIANAVPLSDCNI